MMSGMNAIVRKMMLAIEFAVVFIILPGALCILRIRNPAMRLPVVPILIVVALACLLFLMKSPGFDLGHLWNTGSIRKELRRILITFAGFAIPCSVAIIVAAPDMRFSLLRWNPILWALVMCFYPLLSVYPQEIIFRAFLFHRYREILPHPGLQIAASTLAFGFVHIIFMNWIAVFLTTLGGLVFAYTYHRTKSLAAVWLEHALYGWWIFTIGLGQFFYHGTVHFAETIVH